LRALPGKKKRQPGQESLLVVASFNDLLPAVKTIGTHMVPAPRLTRCLVYRQSWATNRIV
jgi:hypothetical protein